MAPSYESSAQARQKLRAEFVVAITKEEQTGFMAKDCYIVPEVG